MRYYDNPWLKASIAADMRETAMLNYFDGRNEWVLGPCRAMHLPTGSILCFTRDVGMHDCGWFKNPDYNQCEHLSLSFIDPTAWLIDGNAVPAQRNKVVTKEWLEAFFGRHQDKLWVESPCSDSGKMREVWHYRLMYAPGFTAPIVPRREVYSRDFTERNWKSFSEIQGELESSL